MKKICLIYMIVGMLILNIYGCATKPNPIFHPAEYKKAMAEDGSAQDQYDLAVMFHKGLYVKRDDVEALKWFIKAAAQNHVMAQETLGEYYYHGQMIRRDYQKAAMLLRPAAEQGNRDAQYLLGTLYATGYGVEKNLGIANDLFWKAANQGQSQANKILIEQAREADRAREQFAVKKQQESSGVANAVITMALIVAALSSVSGDATSAAPEPVEKYDCMYMTCQELWRIQQEYSIK